MNKMMIEYSNPELRKAYPKKEISAFLKKILSERKLENVEFSVSFIDEDEMHSMNKEYRNIDDSTDILSFAAEDTVDDFEFILPQEAGRNIGDILICPEVMKRNAERFEVSEEEELRRLLIHGILHLTGYDHKTNDPSEPMLVEQEEILRSLTAL